MGYNDFNAPVAQILLDRSLAYIPRWHSRHTAAKESVAEHQYHVGFNAMIITELLSREGYKVDRLKIIQQALVHDHLEKVTGDIPGSAKADIPGARRDVARWEKSAVDLMFAGHTDPMHQWLQGLIVRVAVTRPRQLDQQVIRYCDDVAALAFCIDQVRMGNEFMREIEARVRVMVEGRNWPWLQDLRRKYGIP